MKRLLIITMIALAGTTFACGHTSQQMPDKEARMYIMKNLESLRTAVCQKDIMSIREMFKEVTFFMKKPIMREKEGHTVSVDTVIMTSCKQLLKSLKRTFARNEWIDVKFMSIYDDGEEYGYSITRSKIDPTKYGVILRAKMEAERYSDEGYLFQLWEFPKDCGSPILHVCTWQPVYINGRRQEPNPDNITSLADFDL